MSFIEVLVLLRSTLACSAEDAEPEEEDGHADDEGDEDHKEWEEGAGEGLGWRGDLHTQWLTICVCGIGE